MKKTQAKNRLDLRLSEDIMHLDFKTKIIVNMLDAAAKAMGATKISKQTLMAGVERYIKERCTPDLPTPEPNKKPKVIRLKANNVIDINSRRK